MASPGKSVFYRREAAVPCVGREGENGEEEEENQKLVKNRGRHEELTASPGKSLDSGPSSRVRS